LEAGKYSTNVRNLVAFGSWKILMKMKNIWYTNCHDIFVLIPVKRGFDGIQAI
jgi:hypothetical protein